MGVPLVGWPPDVECLTSAQVETLLAADLIVADDGFDPPGRSRFVAAGAEWLTVASEAEALRIVAEEARLGRAVVRVVPGHRVVAAWAESQRDAGRAEDVRYVPVAGMRPLDVQLARWSLPAAALAEDAWALGSAPPLPDEVGWARGPRSDGVEVELADAAGERYVGPSDAAPWGPAGKPLLARWHPRPARRRPHVLILRADGQAAALEQAVRRAGWVPVLAPILAFESPDWGPVDEHLAHMSRYGWVVFTSSNGVAAFFDRLRYLGLDVRQLSARLAAVGQETSRRLADLCLTIDLVPQDSSQEGLLAAFAGVPHLMGQSVLLVVGNRRGPRLADGLRASGALVDEAVVYRTVPRPLDEDVRRALVGGGIDAVVFTSGSTAQFLWAALGAGERGALAKVQRVSIGVNTSRALEQLGMPPAATALAPNPAGLAAALHAVLDDPARAARDGVMT